MALLGPEPKLLSIGAADTFSAVLNATATIYSQVTTTKYGSVFGIALQGTSVAGGVKFDVMIEQSWKPPTTEYAADTDYVTPNGLSNIVTDRTSELVYIGTLSPVVMPYIRFVITGKTGNSADTLIWIRFARQLDY